MRLAWVTVGSAVVGASVVMLSGGGPPVEAAPLVAPAPATVAAPARLEPKEPGSCPPCGATPLPAEAWPEKLASLEGIRALERAAAVSAALPDPAAVTAALEGDDPALRSLAALLLNVGSRRVAACTPVGRRTVLQVLDRLDQLALAVRAGREVPADVVAHAAMQADIVSRGLVPGCGS